ncbi:MAG: TraR/DksA family transcriptional regulator [Bdellovibrionota bacterium]
MATKTNKPKAAAMVAKAAGSAGSEPAKTVEAKLTRLLRLTDEAEAEKILAALKGHGLTKTQVVVLVETIRREEQEIIYGDKVIRGELQTNQEDLMDEADLASSDIDQGMKMRMANRENFKVKRLHRALDKIKDGSYGECDSCGSDIGFARLSARSIAELCIACKEDEERKENLSAVGRKPKSMGHTLGSKLTVS